MFLRTKVAREDDQKLTHAPTPDIPASDTWDAIKWVRGLLPVSIVAGGVLFGGPSGAFAQDATKLFWDNTNKRLGIGTAGPVAVLEVDRAGATNYGSIVDVAARSAVLVQGSSNGNGYLCLGEHNSGPVIQASNTALNA